MILDWELKPGSKILQEHLAQRLSVSRTPLVKALRILESDGLVETAPNRGAFVRKFSKKEMLWMYDIREALEGIAAREAASIATDQQIEELRDIFKDFSPPLENVDIEAYTTADIGFHQKITELCQNQMLFQINTSFNILLRTYQEGLTRSPSRTLPEHMAIIDALSSHEEELSENLMREHLRRAKRSFERRLLSEL
ncbi:MAG: FCD domain-containing protein [Proteobacteria bacterium]|nr:FCD domain-containing protein [Pseudomonadota bacterium]